MNRGSGIGNTFEQCGYLIQEQEHNNKSKTVSQIQILVTSGHTFVTMGIHEFLLSVLKEVIIVIKVYGPAPTAHSLGSSLQHALDQASLVVLQKGEEEAVVQSPAGQLIPQGLHLDQGAVCVVQNHKPLGAGAMCRHSAVSISCHTHIPVALADCCFHGDVHTLSKCFDSQKCRTAS